MRGHSFRCFGASPRLTLVSLFPEFRLLLYSLWIQIVSAFMHVENPGASLIFVRFFSRKVALLDFATLPSLLVVTRF